MGKNSSLKKGNGSLKVVRRDQFPPPVLKDTRGGGNGSLYSKGNWELRELGTEGTGENRA
jgi:hypothetical protein